jgi:hypothetical protein
MPGSLASGAGYVWHAVRCATPNGAVATGYIAREQRASTRVLAWSMNFGARGAGSLDADGVLKAAAVVCAGGMCGEGWELSGME